MLLGCKTTTNKQNWMLLTSNLSVRQLYTSGDAGYSRRYTARPPTEEFGTTDLHWAHGRRKSLWQIQGPLYKLVDRNVHCQRLWMGGGTTQWDMYVGVFGLGETIFALICNDLICYITLTHLHGNYCIFCIVRWFWGLVNFLDRYSRLAIII